MRKSVYSIQYWVDKGFSVEDAGYQIKIRRPTNILYWIHRGYSEQQAEEEVKKFQKNTHKNRNSYREGSKRCIEYYIKRGYDETEARKEISKLQSTFSLEKCQKKYGIEEGLIRWSNRQEQWQKTLQEKSPEEKKIINDKKNAFSLQLLRKKFNSDKQIQQYLLESKNICVYLTVDEFDSVLKQRLFESPDLYYSSAERLFKLIPKIQFELLDLRDPVSFLQKYVANDSSVVFKSASRGSYRKWVGSRLLRSSFEIFFYQLLCEKSIKCDIDGQYPNSSMRYDFYLPRYGRYVEIAPQYDFDEKYRMKMDKKKELFGCVLLKNTEDFIMFINSLGE